MVSCQTKQDILVSILVIAIIGGILGTLLYVNNIPPQQDDDNQTPPVDPIPDENQTTPDENTTDLNDNNVTELDNNQTHFEQVCNIEPKAEVCIKTDKLYKLLN